MDILSQAMALHQADRLEEAQALYRRVLAQYPEHPDVLHLLGVVTWRLGDGEAGPALIRQAIERNPGYGPYYFNLANLYRRQQDLLPAVACLEQGLAAAPNYLPLHETHTALCHNFAVEATEADDPAGATAWCRRTLDSLRLLPGINQAIYDLLERLI